MREQLDIRFEQLQLRGWTLYERHVYTLKRLNRQELRASMVRTSQKSFCGLRPVNEVLR